MKTNAVGTPVILVGRQRLWRLHERLRTRLPVWVVYRPVTAEYPGLWVTRMHLTLPEPRTTRFVMTHDSLAELRTLLPPGLVLFQRFTNDEPEIEEVWL